MKPEILKQGAEAIGIFINWDISQLNPFPSGSWQTASQRASKNTAAKRNAHEHEI